MASNSTPEAVHSACVANELSLLNSGGWRQVQPGRYAWSTSANSTSLCEQLKGRSLLLIGDSSTGQFWKLLGDQLRQDRRGRICGGSGSLAFSRSNWMANQPRGELPFTLTHSHRKALRARTHLCGTPNNQSLECMGRPCDAADKSGPLQLRMCRVQVCSLQKRSTCGTVDSPCSGCDARRRDGLQSLCSAVSDRAEFCASTESPTTSPDEVLSKHPRGTAEYATGGPEEWMKEEWLRPFGVVVANTGLHYVPERMYHVHMRRAAAVLAEHARVTGAEIFFRTSVPGLGGCDAHRSSPPLHSVADAEAAYARQSFQLQATFLPRWNRIATDVFVRAGARILDAYTPSILRLDARVGGADCLHYRAPLSETPLQRWAELLGLLLERNNCRSTGRAAMGADSASNHNTSNHSTSNHSAVIRGTAVRAAPRMRLTARDGFAPAEISPCWGQVTHLPTSREPAELLPAIWGFNPGLVPCASDPSTCRMLSDSDSRGGDGGYVASKRLVGGDAYSTMFVRVSHDLKMQGTGVVVSCVTDVRLHAAADGRLLATFQSTGKCARCKGHDAGHCPLPGCGRSSGVRATHVAALGDLLRHRLNLSDVRRLHDGCNRESGDCLAGKLPSSSPLHLSFLLH